MSSLSLFALVFLLALLPVLSVNPRTQTNVVSPSALAVSRLRSIDHFIVLMLENESFDQLFPDIPNTESIQKWQAGQSTIPYFYQTDATGKVLSSLPAPLCSGVPCGNFTASIPNAPYLASTYWPEGATSSFDVTHRYYQEQWQINGGAMDHYVLWGAQATNTSTGYIYPTSTGWAMQYWDVSHESAHHTSHSPPPPTLSYLLLTFSSPLCVFLTVRYMGALAQNFTVMDHFFHSFFGGSTPGAISLFQGALPTYNASSTGCPASLVTTFATPGNTPTTDGSFLKLDGALDASCRMINDMFAPGFGNSASVFMPTNETTIGDLLTAANISWVWYAQNFGNATAQAPYGLSTAHFAYHHHAPLFYQRFVNSTSPKWGQPDFVAHNQDESNFFNALAAGTGLPSVSYVRPSPDDDMHPAQNNPELAQAHLAAYLNAIFSSTYWQNNKTAVFISFDENGGYFDVSHSAPHFPSQLSHPTCDLPCFTSHPLCVPLFSLLACASLCRRQGWPRHSYSRYSDLPLPRQRRCELVPL